MTGARRRLAAGVAAVVLLAGCAQASACGAPSLRPVA
jgi:hypothetical protein